MADQTTPPIEMSGEELKEAMRAHYRAWDKRVNDMQQSSAQVDWSKTDWSKLNPKDVGVEFGPIMDAAQLAEYKKGRHIHVLKGPSRPAK